MAILDSQQRVIRVFISSTFRDMKAERDYLVKFIFPQLRQLCEERQVVWGEVDLRWGVTDEQVAEGKVLPICLEEIKRCRPYFIGLLGERYGWIPEEIPDDMIERESWLKEYAHVKKSVTELEILHGVLNNPEMADHAYFYFRNPDYVNNLPEDINRTEFISETPEAATKLSELKKRIRNTQFRVHENYKNPQHLGELVLKDFTKIIETLYPEASENDLLKREAMDQEMYAQSRRRVYIGRSEYFDRLDEYAESSDDKPFVIIGEAGSGKSSLLANWVSHYFESHSHSNNDQSYPFILQHYIGVSPYSADWTAIVRRIMSEFKRRFEIQFETPDDPKKLKSVFFKSLQMAAGKGKIILVLDALDQLSDLDGSPNLFWLPHLIPMNIRLIVSTLPGQTLDEIEKRGWPKMRIELLTIDERRKLIQKFLEQYSKELNSQQKNQISAAPQTGNPLHLTVLLDELRQFGEHERLAEHINHYLKADSVSDLYRRVIKRWDKDYGGEIDLVKQSLSLIWAARRGLTESELLDIVGKGGEPLSRAIWSPLYLAMSNSLISQSGLLSFANDHLRTAILEEYLSLAETRKQKHLRLANYFEVQSTEWRRIDESSWQLAKTESWQRLFDIMADPNFFKKAWEHNRFDNIRYWALIEASSNLRMVDAYHQQINHPEQEPDKDFLQAIGELLTLTVNLKESFIIYFTLSEHYKKYGNQKSYGLCLNNYAFILKSMGDLDGAMDLYQKSAEIFLQLEDMNVLPNCLIDMGLLLYSRGDYESAMELYNKAEEICISIGDGVGLVRCLGNEQLIWEARGNIDKAIGLLNLIEHIYRQTKDLYGLRITLGNQGRIHHLRGDRQKALELHEEEKNICLQLGDREGLQQSIGNQANIYLTQGDLSRAMKLYEKQENICREIGSLEGLQRSLMNQGTILYLRGDLSGSLMLNKEGEKICRQIQHTEGLQRSYANIALICEAQGDLDMAMKLLKEQEEICRDSEFQNSLQKCYANQSRIYENRGDKNKAMALLKKSEQIFRKIGNLDDLQKNLGDQARIIVDTSGDLQEAIVLQKEKVKICRQLGDHRNLQSSLGDQGKMCARANDFPGAMKVLQEQESMCRQLEDNNLLAESLWIQSSVLLLSNQIQGAISKAVEAYDLAVANNIDKLVAKTKAVLSKIAIHIEGLANDAIDAGDFSKADQLLKEEQRICEKGGDQIGLGYAIHTQAVVAMESGNPEKAIDLFKKVEKLSIDLQDSILPFAIAGQAEVYAFHFNNSQAALPLAERAYKLACEFELDDTAKQIEDFLEKVRALSD